MDLKQLVKEEQEESRSIDDNHHHHQQQQLQQQQIQIDSSSALQSFLDHIPITPILSISPNSSTVLELKSNDCVRDAINLLYTKNTSGASIIDNVDSDLRKFVDRDIGFIEFSSMVLWSLKEFGRIRAESKGESIGFLPMLEKNPQVGETKIGELAKSFLWEPFFPVNSNDTLFHVLLLFAKHPRLKVIPVVESSNSRVVSYINQNAVVHLLLQSNGLDWFDQIADKAIAEFEFEKAGRFFYVHGDQSVADALHVLWEEQTDGVPVVDKENETLIGVVRRSDIRLLLEDNNIFNNLKSLTVKEFIETYSDSDQRPKLSADGSCSMHLSACALLLNHEFLPKPSTFVTNQKSSYSLKQAMKSLVSSNSSQSFLVNKSGKLEGIVTIRDIISQFSPPSLDSRIDGGGFFDAALEQAGCYVKDGSLICNR